ncbi:MAG: hypothetical protein ICV66_11715, partial [Chitinophagaceae bacterium]|nr:hypothetical protein [Chitinophagaceae bacterium]
MQTKTISVDKWLPFTLFTGFTAFVCYFIAIAGFLPYKISILCAFAFGPLLMLALLGMYHICKDWKNSLWLQSAVVFNIVATAFVTMMFVVQQSMFLFHDKFVLQPQPTVTPEQLKLMLKEVNSVQLGMDVAWDIFICAGTFLLALSFWGHPALKKFFLAIGMVLSVLALAFNMWYFPVPPGETGSIDFGPFVALWYIIMLLLLY